MDKQILRKECLKKRSLLPKKALSYKEIKEYIASAQTVFCYVSFGSEIITLPFLSEILQNKKTLVVPKCLDTSGNMIAVRITSLNDLSEGLYGILEPKSFEPFDKSLIDAAIIPGAAFDSSGYRLGYGKGYYDRFLSETAILKIGICHKELFFNTIPHLDHDIKCDSVITL